MTRSIRKIMALQAIDEAGRGLTYTELGDKFGTARGVWSFILKSLEDEGLICRFGRGWNSARITSAGIIALEMSRGLLKESKKKPRSTKRVSPGLAEDGGTRFKKRLAEPGSDPVLKPGRANQKLGGEVIRGRHAGKELYSLTLEEGVTCPPCDLANICYGGNMYLAKRYAGGAALEDALRRQIPTLGPALIRLHVLGDFYSEEYARMWVEEFKVPVFGYTHHHLFSTIGRRLFSAPWETFSIRKSFKHGSKLGAVKTRGAVTISSEKQATENDAIICPEQTGQVKNCASCGLCWSTQRNIAFLQH